VKLYVVGYSGEWLEPGAQGLIIGATKTQDYLIVKLDEVDLPTYIRAANLKLGAPGGLEDLSFSDNHVTVEYWPGDRLNKPEVAISIKTWYTHLDRDYGTETEVTGDYELGLDEMVELRDFLDKAIDKAKDWKYKGTS